MEASCSAGTNLFPISAFSGTPVVFLGRNENIHQPENRCLVSDANAVAELAAHELISLHLESYAYVTWTKPTYWSAARLAGFESALSLHGVKPCTFDSTLVNGDSAELIASLAEWLTRLPMPIGVFAANDRMASTVMDACMLAKLAIPDDVSIVGVDNDEELGERLRLDRVADLCGYKSLPSFSNFFRAETGQSPSSWRDSGGT